MANTLIVNSNSSADQRKNTTAASSAAGFAGMNCTINANTTGEVLTVQPEWLDGKGFITIIVVIVIVIIIIVARVVYVYKRK